MTNSQWGNDNVGTVYRSQAFAAYALAQVSYAQVVLARHTLDGCGLCRCGRNHPCDEHRHWRRMMGHYQSCIDKLVLDSPLVRPYVTVDQLGGWHER
jgi:hypothetical protein